MALLLFENKTPGRPSGLAATVAAAAEAKTTAIEAERFLHDDLLSN
jgi:hypothetical protein